MKIPIYAILPNRAGMEEAPYSVSGGTSSTINANVYSIGDLTIRNMIVAYGLHRLPNAPRPDRIS